MKIPPNLAVLLDRGHKEIFMHPLHDLPLGFRQLIYKEMGDCQREIGVPSAGHRRRYELARISIEKVLPIWKNSLPKDDCPSVALQTAQQLMEEKILPEVASIHHGNLWSTLDDLVSDRSDLFKCITVGYGAAQVISVALDDTFMCPLEFDCTLTDKQVNPEDLDAPFCAAAAYSEGTVWDSTSSPTKRELFWKWWLDDAVSAAWLCAGK